MDKQSKAVVIFSGGQDSTTCLAWALKHFDHVEAVTFDYGQKHRVELEAAQKICADLGVPQMVLPLDSLRVLGSNALVDSSIKVQDRGGLNDLPSTFVPGRNALFLMLAAAYAAPRGIADLVIGTCETDFSGYPDCRQIFLDSIQQTLGLAMGRTFQIHAPLMKLNKAETFSMAAGLDALDLVLKQSHTCYEGDHQTWHDWGYGCGQCPACLLRARGFRAYQEGVQNG